MNTRKAIANLVSNIILQIITAIIGFILPRLFLTTYGSSINGLISSIKQFLSYLKVIEAGVGQASIAALYKPLNNNDTSKINGILSATNLFYRRSGYLFIILVILLAFLYPKIIGNEVNSELAFYMVLVLGVTGMWEYLLIGKYRVLLVADQRGYVIFIIQTFLLIISTCISIILIYMNYSIIIVMAVSTSIMLTNIIFIEKYIRKTYKYFNANIKPDTNEIKNKWDALTHQIAGMVVFNTPLVIITIFEGLIEVSVYTIYSMVFNAITLFVSTFSTAMLAVFGNLIARGNDTHLEKNFKNFEYIFYAVVAFLYTCSSVLVLPFIEVYTKGVEDADYTRPLMATLFIIIGIANAIRIPSNTLINSAGHFKETKRSAVIEAIINLTTSLTFVQFFGTEGVLLGGLCSYAYRTLNLIMYSSKNILKKPSKQTFIMIVRNFVLATIAFVPFMLINVIAESFFVWICWAIGISFWTISVVVIGNYFMDSETMREIVTRLKKKNKK